MKRLFIFLIFLINIIALPIVYAHCPLCTGAVVAGAAGAKYLGFDASVIGVFVGGAAISLGVWMSRLLKKKYIPLQTVLIVIATFLLTVIPVKAAVNDALYLPIVDNIYWLNKIIFGSLIGGIVTILAYWTHLTIKRFRGKVLFPFQGIVLTVLFLIIASLILQFTII